MNAKKWWFYFSIGLVLLIFIKTDFTGIMTLVMRILTPFVIAFVLAYLLIPLKLNLEKKFIRRGKKFAKKHCGRLSAAIVYICFIIFALAIILFIVPVIKKSIVELSRNAPQYYSNVSAWINDIINNEHFTRLNLNKYANNFSIDGMISKFNYLNISKYFIGLISFTGLIFDIIMGLIILIYVLLEHKNLRKTFDKVLYKIFGRSKGDEIELCINKAGKIFNKFIYGKLIISVIIGIVAGIVFAIIKVPYAFLSGLIIAVTNMIPYFGPFIGGAFIALIALIGKGWVYAVWTIIVIIVAQQIDSYILTPKILGNSMGLSPFWIIFSIILGGGLFGFWGMFLGVPVAAVIRMVWYEYIEKIQQRN